MFEPETSTEDESSFVLTYKFVIVRKRLVVADIIEGIKDADAALENAVRDFAKFTLALQRTYVFPTRLCRGSPLLNVTPRCCSK